MLPDYPKAKALIAACYRAHMWAAQQKRMGFFSQIRGTRLFEGRRLATYRPDGSFDESDLEETQGQAQLHHDTRHLETLTGDTIVEVLDTLGQTLAESQLKLLFREIDEGVEKAGNVSCGKKSTVEQVFEVIKNIYLDFNDHGQPGRLHIHAGEQAMARLNEAFVQIQTDPELKKRFDNLIEAKRHEWLDREAARNLVD